MTHRCITQCWSEGALRAYLDRELPAQDMELVAAHLAQCAECAGLSMDLAARARRVAVWLEALPEPEVIVTGSPAGGTMPRPTVARRRWIGLAAALAAGLVLLLPRPNHRAVESGPSVAVGPPPIVPAAPDPVPRATTQRPIARTAAASRKIRRPRVHPAMPANHFLALDDEPIETGVIMRVGVEPGNFQADIVFGPDGRAHAIRLVNARN